MQIAQQLIEAVTAFVEGRIALSELQLWLAERVQAIADLNDPHTTELSHELWILVGEWLDGLRDEPDVRAELAEFLAEETRRTTQRAPAQTS